MKLNRLFGFGFAFFFGAIFNASALEHPNNLIHALSNTVHDEPESVIPLEIELECGARGSSETRITDCGLKRSLPNGKAWKLVSRTSDGRESWRDESTGLVWTLGRFSTKNYESAFSSCKAINDGIFPNRIWGSYASNQMNEAMADGFAQIFPEMQKSFQYVSVDYRLARVMKGTPPLEVMMARSYDDKNLLTPCVGATERN